MPPSTPNTSAFDALAPMASRYVAPDSLPWVPSRFPGVDLKVLMQDPASGLSTVLTRFAPGARLPDHEHVDLEQSYVLEGSLQDGEGIARAGDYVWRPAGSRHEAHSVEGCIVLSMFLQPNRFFDEG